MTKRPLLQEFVDGKTSSILSPGINAMLLIMVIFMLIAEAQLVFYWCELVWWQGDAFDGCDGCDCCDCGDGGDGSDGDKDNDHFVGVGDGGDGVDVGDVVDVMVLM